MRTQLGLELDLILPAEAYNYGERSSGDAHGVVLTKPHVVDLILDLADYRASKNLAKLRLLEPSCGEGAFVVPAVRRLLAAARRHKAAPSSLGGCIRAFDIDPKSVEQTRRAVRSCLEAGGIESDVASDLVEEWIAQRDFLLAPLSAEFDAVVGNPPYVRIEQLSPDLQKLYRRRFSTIYDRADLYVAFIQRGLDLLGPSGVLSYICADRWTMNRYGAPLRKLISERFAVRAYVDLHQASPFESDVIAYPSIFAFQRRETDRVLFAKLHDGSASECEEVAALATGEKGTKRGSVEVSWYDRWFSGDDPWVLSGPAQLAALRDLESRFPTLEAGGKTRVGIGVATGSDEVYIVGEGSGVEADRLVPLVMRSDIKEGRIEWQERYVLNTFAEDGRAVDLAAFPGLARRLEQNKAAVQKRDVSGRSGTFWFRTIDRVYPELVGRPKLLIPDIAGANEVAFDRGQYHPHHNLYFITSDSWDLEVLGGLLSSKVALFFVWSYAVKMRGGYLRFQAQYIRRIRVPDPATISKKVQASLRSAFRARNFGKLDALALQVYGLDSLPDFAFVDTRS